MFILSQSKLSMESKRFFYESFIAHQPEEGYEIKIQNYAVIWSQMFSLPQSKLSIKSKTIFYKSLIAHQQKKRFEIKRQNYAVIWSE